MKQAGQTMQFQNEAKHARKVFKCKLNLLTALDDSSRSTPCSEKAVSLQIYRMLNK